MKSILAKPAVRMVTVWKKLTSNFSKNGRFPIVSGLFHSVTSVSSVPADKMIAVIARTTLV